MTAGTIKPIKVFYLLSLTLILVLWLEQRSINAYWIQTYHQTSPLTPLENNTTWNTGGRIANFMEKQLGKLQEQITTVNDSMVNAVNGHLIIEDNSELESGLPQKIVFNLDSIFYPRQLLIFPHNYFMQILPAEEQITIHPHIFAINSAEQILKTDEHAKQSKVDLLANKNLFLLDKGQKVFFVGDSLMQGVAPHAMRELSKQHNIESINLSKQSTGLAYPNFFNWPQIAEDTFTKNPDIKLMVVFMGPNDPWDFPVIKGGRFFKFSSAEWEGVYRARIQRLINTAIAHDAKVLWIGAPNMRDQKLNAGIIRLNKIYQSQVTIADQHYIPSNDILGMEDDKFVKFIKLPKRGNVTLRTDDGIHFTTIGQKRIADKILSMLRFNEPTDTTDK